MQQPRAVFVVMAIMKSEIVVMIAIALLDMNAPTMLAWRRRKPTDLIVFMVLNAYPIIAFTVHAVLVQPIAVIVIAIRSPMAIRRLARAVLQIVAPAARFAGMAPVSLVKHVLVAPLTAVSAHRFVGMGTVQLTRRVQAALRIVVSVKNPMVQIAMLRRNARADIVFMVNVVPTKPIAGMVPVTLVKRAQAALLIAVIAKAALMHRNAVVGIAFMANVVPTQRTAVMAIVIMEKRVRIVLRIAVLAQ